MRQGDNINSPTTARQLRSFMSTISMYFLWNVLRIFLLLTKIRESFMSINWTKKSTNYTANAYRHRSFDVYASSTYTNYYRIECRQVTPHQRAHAHTSTSTPINVNFQSGNVCSLWTLISFEWRMRKREKGERENKLFHPLAIAMLNVEYTPIFRQLSVKKNNFIN